MEPAFWLSRWEAQQIGFHQDTTNTHLAAHWAKLKLSDSRAATGASAPCVFVPLCGKSSDMLWLRAQGLAVLGVELSPRAVHDFFDENALTPRMTRQGQFERWEAEGIVIVCGDLFALRPEDLDGVCAVYDRAALIALPPAMRFDYARQMQRLQPVGTPTLLITMEYPQSEMDGPPFAVPEEEVRAIFKEWHTIERIAEADVLAENAPFRARGLSALHERVYLMTR